jgi:hypothetical protein
MMAKKAPVASKTKKAIPAKPSAKGAPKATKPVLAKAKAEQKPSKAPPSLKTLSTMRPPRLGAALLAPKGSAATPLPANLQAVIDKSEIRDLIYRLARGLDRVDETLLRSVFHPDATLDFGPGVFQGTSNDYIHWVIGVMNQVRSSHHLIGNIHTTLEGDVALTESYCQAHFRLDKPTGREDVFIGSRYLDRIERNPSGAAGVWKVMHRKQVIDWVRTEAVSDLFYHHNPDALWSYRTKTDPSYQMAQFPGSQNGSKLPSFLGRRYESKSVKF